MRAVSSATSPVRPVTASAHGFTLIELLVALFIAAVMFAMGYGAINQALQNRGAIRRHQQNLVQLETAMSLIEQDFVQLAPRPVRQPVGDGYLPCLQGGPMSGAAGTADASTTSDSAGDSADSGDSAGDSDTSGSSTPLVVLTRNGWSNPTGLQRPELERVAYVLDHGTLVREHWNVLDATLSSTPIKRNLLKHLRGVTFRYMSINRSWVDTWPPAPTAAGGLAGLAGPNSLYWMRPLAVEVTLDTKQWGKIMRIFEIAQ